jgi:rubrerythrin
MVDIIDVKDAIKTAIQMEKDGYSFYKKAASQTTSEMGSSIFESIANDELLHLEVFEKMFKNIVGKDEWNELVNSSKKYSNINVFPKDLKGSDDKNLDITDLDALRIAMDSEKEAIDFYTKIREKLNNDQVIEIINEIIEQEKKHYRIFEGEFHHINSTGYWFDLDFLGT